MTDTRWLSDHEQRAWRKLAALMSVVPTALDGQLQRDSGLTMFGYWVLAMLSEAPGRQLRMSHLAQQSNASASRVSHVVSRLEQQGFVARRKAEDDARGSIAELTEDGMAKVVASAPGHVEQVRSLIMDGLGPGQVELLDELCTALLAQVDPDGTLSVAPPG
ncbi:MarR family winged helix-turn-helix transcriptional regulator [Saccharopolyspora dendranthemae]|uniref:DNA-binding MarR family transcriptional regulator n=1 Tax=Saccharopolyspora dendranthemae TaxID=1181886 RepID=A0A561U8N6_9PSEU|nr:MarR family transcriptional regulator [Saccharopolyspora dendranthemae]TWF95736.1 DNA-binding MarR family transcriptional regulator [Saccharopolyspora dendranthemae]